MYIGLHILYGAGTYSPPHVLRALEILTFVLGIEILLSDC